MLYLKLYNLTLKQKQVFLCICSLQFVWFIRQFTFSVKCKSMRDICVNIWISKMDNFYSKVTRTCIKETWKMITTTQIEDLLERNEILLHSFAIIFHSWIPQKEHFILSNKWYASLHNTIHHTNDDTVVYICIYNIYFLSPSISTPTHDSARTMDRRSGWSPPAVGSRCHESCQILASLCPPIWHNTCWHGSYN